jgi:hypothetical protein
MDWAALQACPEESVPGNAVAKDEGAVDKCSEDLTSAMQEATATSASRRRPLADPRPRLPATIQDETA